MTLPGVALPRASPMSATMDELLGPRNGRREWVGAGKSVAGRDRSRLAVKRVRTVTSQIANYSPREFRRSPLCQREHSMAIRLSQLLPLQELDAFVGIAPVMSPRSTLRNDSAAAKSCERQYELATTLPHSAPVVRQRSTPYPSSARLAMMNMRFSACATLTHIMVATASAAITDRIGSPLWRNCPRTLVAKARKNATAQ